MPLFSFQHFHIRRLWHDLVRPVAPFLATLRRGSSAVCAVTTLVRHRGRSVASGSGSARGAVAAAGGFGPTVGCSVPGCCRLTTGSTVSLRCGTHRAERKYVTMKIGQGDLDRTVHLASRQHYGIRGDECRKNQTALLV